MSELASKLLVWKRDPVQFVRENFGVEPDWWQVDMLRAFAKRETKRLLGMACKGPGKTALLAWLGWNFLATRPHCKVPCASISGANLKDGLWAEFKKWQNRSAFLSEAFLWTHTRIFEKKNPGTWFASFRTWAQDADPQQQANTIAGLHEDFLLWLLDEGSDMPDGVVSAAEAALTGGVETKLAMMGNCTRTDGPLWRAAGVNRKLWHITRITGDPDDPKRSPRIDIEEARRQIAEYGRDSYIVKVNILAEFPDRQADKLLDVRDCEEAMDRHIAKPHYEHEARVLGADVAYFGDDHSTICPRQGRASFKIKKWGQLDTIEFADKLIQSVTKWEADQAFLDIGGGYGAGVYDSCKSRGFSRLIKGINFGSKAADDKKFQNKRAEMYWLACEWVKEGGALPTDPELAAELCAPRYFHDKNQRICLEPKIDIKARLGRSPDKADGFVLTFASPVMTKRSRALNDARAASRARSHDYDPLDNFTKQTTR